ncbi:xanthine dehydrogenase family protein molybdopterin-binding subunit [Sphingomonas sp. BIUV-7]|uniref:Xanthine dehydrogenase family protein molybdopterin-binding subunit n=1 Tax=Sphingomonas natans TaxID=3063330 RepID=A0ABT8YBA4_9SPHN|nr:xanthine dehydrogenase family protein molybdopterin-binding subunit [Sphingomonas sp. BIUV-7]MDO6414989.1 xanthine dehydrogenase family protein molybdopterin-binding subunit [Sphingomonas sp. BIUV-7]
MSDNKLADAKAAVQGAVQGVMMKAIAVAPDSWIPGGVPDPLIVHQHGHVGRSLSRIDGPLKVRGAAPFAAEFPMDGMVYAAVLFSTIARGRIATIDAQAAEAAEGVALVMTYKNAPRMKPMPGFGSNAKAAGGASLPVMQDPEIHWNGQPIAVVLAETQEQADHATSLIDVTYEVAPSVTSFAEAKGVGVEPGLFMGSPLKIEIGDAEAALAAAPHRIDAVYETPYHTHNPIELHAATVAWQGDTLRIHDASQAVAHMAWSMGHMFGIGEDQVHVTSPFVGGGFGSKTLWQHQVLAAAAAKLVGRPVRIMLSREGVYRVVGGRSLTEQRVAIGAGADGVFAAIVHTGISATTRSNAFPEPFILPTMSVYGAGSFKLEVDIAYVDMLANTFMRAPGEAVGTFALECAIDELAHQIGMDPIEIRHRNEPDKDPVKGLPHSQLDIAKAYAQGAEAFGWNKRKAVPGSRREGEWLIGMGVATGTYPYHRMPGGAARMTLTRDGHATIEIAAHEMGMGTATAHTQVTADRLGLGLDQVTFRYGDSLMPGVVLAGGSQQTASIGASIIAAHALLVTELLQLAGNDSPLAGLKPDEVGGRDGGLCKLDEPERFESYASILSRAQRNEISVLGEAAKPLELQHWSMHSHGAMFCEVKVSTVTGETRVSRFLGSFDCGRILNPKTAMSQFRGGIIMGLGLALTEETLLDTRSGRIMNPSLSDYHVPVHMDVPEIDVIWTDIPDPHTPMGARGIGEIGITGVGAAVANAVFNATGKRIRSLPITLDKLL